MGTFISGELKNSVILILIDPCRPKVVTMRIPILAKKEGSAVVPEKNTPPKASLELHPLPSKNALLVKVLPPTEPERQIKHVSSDIVLVIDISGSMSSRADVPGEDPSESPGLSVLDLVKHAATTIIESLDEGDRLGIVTFCSKSEIVQQLTVMIDENKKTTRERIKKITPRDSTNMWHGILNGLDVFRDGGQSTRVPSMMLLTDGMPNLMNPSMGYIPKMRTMAPFTPTISPFGFGYNLHSGLLKSIAEIGNGSYAFIPDAGMIGTVFVHAVANLQSTFATQAELQLDYTEPLVLRESTGETVDRKEPEIDGPRRRLRINLGTLQFGQSRDLFLKVENLSSANPFDDAGAATVSAELLHKTTGNAFNAYDDPSRDSHLCEGSMQRATARCSMMSDSDLAPEEVAYHDSRSQICEFVSSLFPIDAEAKHKALKDLSGKGDELRKLIDALPAQGFSDDKNQSLLKDLKGPEPQGQISLALRSDYYEKWGKHYLPSLLNAHVRQACNTFKDPGPLQYGLGSPLFTSCRTHLDDVFERLPPPEPSLPPRGAMLARGEKIAMSRYHNPAGVCFAGGTLVELASGRKVAIRKLRRGVKVKTPLGSAKVHLVLKTPVQGETLCQVGDTYVTPWHPISADGKTWAFPATLAQKVVRYTGCVYSVMLARHPSSEAHGIRVGEFWGVTLGHGVLTGDDVRAHLFFGDYGKVNRALLASGVSKKGIAQGKGAERNGKTGLVDGLRKSYLSGVDVHD